MTSFSDQFITRGVNIAQKMSTVYRITVQSVALTLLEPENFQSLADYMHNFCIRGREMMQHL